LVHHGYFWPGEAPALRGYKALRIGALFRQGISLLAYHLPLDAHPDQAEHLNKLSGLIDDAAMSKLNAEVDVKKKSVTEVAAGFLKANNL
jgi:putative NIF3 family GTP cyclohydrolase 1 type 2